jgi:hypothetical protein
MKRLNKWWMVLIFLLLTGCMMAKYNHQDIDLPNGGSVHVRTPITQDTPALVKVTPIPITFTNTVDGVDTVGVGYIYEVETSSGTQHNTKLGEAEIDARYNAFKIYHWCAVGLGILGVIMIVLKKPPEIITGVLLIISGVAFGVFGGIMPELAKYSIHIFITAVILCAIYVITHRYLDKKKTRINENSV